MGDHGLRTQILVTPAFMSQRGSTFMKDLQFYETRKLIKDTQVLNTLRWGRSSSVGPRCCLMTILALRLSSAKLKASNRFLFMIL